MPRGVWTSATGAEGGGNSRGGFSTIERSALDPCAEQRAPAGARGLHLRCDPRGPPLALVLTPSGICETRAFADLVDALATGTRCLIGEMGCDADRIREGLLPRASCR